MWVIQDFNVTVSLFLSYMLSLRTLINESAYRYLACSISCYYCNRQCELGESMGLEIRMPRFKSVVPCDLSRVA